LRSGAARDRGPAFGVLTSHPAPERRGDQDRLEQAIPRSQRPPSHAGRRGHSVGRAH
jgi:hypothetical protein